MKERKAYSMVGKSEELFPRNLQLIGEPKKRKKSSCMSPKEDETMLTSSLPPYENMD